MNTLIQSALQAAIEAAREAGAALLAEMQRPGGPRGQRGTAPIDAVAEDLVRTRLTAAFPEFGFRAEERPELNRAARCDPSYTWLVDPNDGTSAFQAGHRGASVSIALLEGGDPVLGVVFAYAAPDDEGDLLAWARGCGPLTRNGVPVTHPGWPAALQRDHVVLISNAADQAPLGNAAAVSPARYRPVPGIAYRLALVAAGDGVAAVSLFSSRDFDLAGGHALLIGVGGTLVDERGRPVRYHPDRSTRVGFCFGGGVEVCATLVKRDWAAVLKNLPRQSEPSDAPGRAYAPVAPGLGPALDPARLRRAQGCWLGQLAGDALGSQVEFQTAAQIAQAWPDGVRDLLDGGTFDTLAGQPTDDSELALMLGRSLVAEGGFDEDAVARAYGHWYRSQPFDLGNTIRRALSAVRPESAHPAAESRAAADPDSQANGALMRVSPLAIRGASLDPDKLAEWAAADARLTHPHPACQDANVVFTAAVAHAVRSGADARATYQHALEVARGLERPAVANWLDAAATGPPADFQRHQGWVRIALHNAFYQLLHAPDLAEGLVDTVGRGGDTDTNAAIAGALLGAVHGRDAVPLAWRQQVMTCRPIAGLEAVRRPRPIEFWPIDALVLPERLLRP